MGTNSLRYLTALAVVTVAMAACTTSNADPAALKDTPAADKAADDSGGDSSDLTPPRMTFTIEAEGLGRILSAEATYHLYEPAGASTPTPRMTLEAYSADDTVFAAILEDDALGPPVGEYTVARSARVEWQSSSGTELQAASGKVRVSSVGGGLLEGSFHLVAAGGEVLDGDFSGRWSLECATAGAGGSGSPGTPDDGAMEAQWTTDLELESMFCATKAAELRPPQAP